VKQRYFILVLAHSVHGRIQRIHIPHSFIYAVLLLAALGAFSAMGFVGSYGRMLWKVGQYNDLRSEVETLRNRYSDLQREAAEQTEQLATLQLFASEVSVAYGLKQNLAGEPGFANEARLVPTVSETIEQYNFLKSADYSRLFREYVRKRHANSVPSIWPVNGRLMDNFGKRIDPFSGLGAFHSGVDINGNFGDAIKATADGIVTMAGWMGGYGRMVVIDHGQYQTRYAHLSSMRVTPGMEVRRGEVIGGMGNSGRATGIHLHYEVRINGVAINPYPFLRRPLTADAKSRDLPF
jgi:murein DD-endopeptidase MepM/ murein hydrolase activator NlpD